MNNSNSDMERKASVLKLARLKLLSLHKTLIDIERSSYENVNGKITSGQFLNLLLNEASFQWLRRFSTLIVEIDEMFDLNDGFTENMIDDYLLQMNNLINVNLVDDDFKNKFESALKKIPEVAVKNEELKSLLAK